MARASSLVVKLDNIAGGAECPICAELFKDPRQLPCLHIFCLECIGKWGEDRCDGDRLACPLCRAEFLVPSGGLENLQKINVFVANLQEVRKSGRVLSVKEAPCDECRGKKGQEMMTLKGQQEQDVGELMQNFPEICCDPDEMLTVYCRESECKKTICLMCFALNHSGHNYYLDVNEAAETMIREMTCDRDRITGKVAEIGELLRKLANGKIELMYKARAVEITIEQRAAKMKQLIEDIKVKELEQVNVVKKQQEKRIESLKEELEERLIMMESLVRYSEELRSKGTAVDIARTANSLHDRADELMQFDVHRLFDEQISSLDIKFQFQTGNAEMKDDLKFLFGQIQSVHAKTDETAAIKVAQMNPKLQWCRPIAASKVTGVAHCDDKLFVVCDECDIIQVFGRDNKQLTSITVTGLDRAADIVACTDTKQLYISDTYNYQFRVTDCVWRVSVDGSRVDKWLTSKSTSTNKFKPSALSLTSRRLLVTSSDNNSLFLFGSDGVQLKHIAIRQPTHAVETSRETFIVCHSKCQISEIDASGHVFRAFHDFYNINADYLSDEIRHFPFPFPIYLAVDSEGRVLVVDYESRRVLLLNSRLELERVLLDAERHKLILNPSRLRLVEQACLLVVASDDRGSDFIQFYNLS